ncbi:DNA mismatch repair protein MutT [Amylibacter marinus]|uniref:DNA mismatch repair protein MutT n=1 Tax=Amylibacter marinus TaxID=1475483 RepID=A0ABQ5VSW4_9RHOB|nr:NUDIX domain-containing protein [Amylibacter marinus]GLQ34249.1 DNA mismatch repair protein MutT [Amylibacter marinus]
MTVWRPQQNIQVKALGLVWRKGLLLASEIYLDDGTVKGVRPLGGRLEFGETWREALVREFDEELGVRVEAIGAPLVLENIYTHQGVVGHEITFVSDVSFPTDAYEQDDTIEYFEDNGEKCTARWYDIDQLDRGDLELYPSGLKSKLHERNKISS